MTIAPSTDLAAGANNADRSLDRRVFGGRYQVLRSLKDSQETQTLLASDLTHGSTVVIKTALAKGAPLPI